jgi:hypothetical protein
MRLLTSLLLALAQAASAAAVARVGRREIRVWANDQSDSPGLTYGGLHMN